MSIKRISCVFSFNRDLVSKGYVIRSKGREAWDRIPKYEIVKDGKRAYISREAFLDNIWLTPNHLRITGY